MRPLLVSLREDDPLAQPLAAAIGGEVARLTLRRFPDGETYLRYDTPPAGRSVVLLCSLDRPDDKTLPLLFAAATARDLGAASVGLVSPYLDRKSVVWGTSVSVRVDLGGRRHIK